MWWKRGKGIAQRGQSVVEFALILPIFLLFLFGVIDLGRAVYAQTVLSNAVRDGARAAVVATRTDDQVVQAVIDAAVGVPLTAANVTISGTRQPGTAVTVSATYVFVPVTPIISRIVGTSLRLTASSTMTVD